NGRLVVDRQASPPGRIHVGEGAVRQLRPVAGTQPSHAPTIAEASRTRSRGLPSDVGRFWKDGVTFGHTGVPAGCDQGRSVVGGPGYRGSAETRGEGGVVRQGGPPARGRSRGRSRRRPRLVGGG